MKSYNKNASCPKCGESRIDTHYRDGSNKTCCKTEVEHLCRFCRNCCYAWAEECIKETKIISNKEGHIKEAYANIAAMSDEEAALYRFNEVFRLLFSR